jgi:hypothetical protein
LPEIVLPNAFHPLSRRAGFLAVGHNFKNRMETLSKSNLTKKLDAVDEFERTPIQER